MEEVTKVIDVDLNAKSGSGYGFVLSILLHPFVISIIIILVVSGIIFTIVQINRVPDLPQAAQKEAAIGQIDNPKVLVEFYADFQCPYCRQFNTTEIQLIEKYKNQSVKFVYIHFPLRSIHVNAQQSAEASEYANDHGKFWEYKDKVYSEAQKMVDNNPSDPNAGRDALSLDNLVRYGEEIGLDGKEMREKIEGRVYKTRVNQQAEKAQSIGINSTPTMILNGKKYKAGDDLNFSLETISSLIDIELQK